MQIYDDDDDDGTKLGKKIGKLQNRSNMVNWVNMLNRKNVFK